MNLTSRLTELRRKHDDLSLRVEREQRSPASDDVVIADMKRQKLRLKEEISRLSAAPQN